MFIYYLNEYVVEFWAEHWKLEIAFELIYIFIDVRFKIQRPFEEDYNNIME